MQRDQKRSRRRAWARRTVAVALLGIGAAGCNSIDKEPPLTYLGKASLKHYEDEATEVAYPAGVEGDVTPVLDSEEPRTVGDRRKDEVWDMTLTEALHCALKGSQVIRTRSTRGQVAGSGLRTNTLTNPDRIPSIYDPAIQETGVLFGGRGVEAALADFDAQFTTSTVWGRNAAYSNNGGGFFGLGGLGGVGGSGQPAFVSTQETAQFQSGFRKQFATGGTANVFHNWNYLGTNQPGTLFPSTYSGATGVAFRQPLLAGGGVEFTRIAGPSNPNFGAITGVTQGVLIARINNDITVADFEVSVRNLMKDVEDTYWDLYLGYRVYDAAVTARNSALRSWREAKARLEIGGVQGFRPADEAQARDRYFETRAQVEAALNQIYLTEAELRRLMGLPPNDGRVIRPVEEPATSKLTPDWHASLADALMFRTELRRQKWSIKSLELQLIAANNLTRPRLDLVSNYQVNGFGDKLLSRGDDDEAGTAQGLDSAYETLLQGAQTGWPLGFELSVPVGFRQAKAQVRNIELRLAKSREVLSAQELDVTHEVADSLQAVEFNYRNAETNFNRRSAAARRVELFEQELEAGTVTLDEVLRAQASLATAEVEYFRSLVQYNQALAYLHFVKGTLLERDGVTLEEGTWTPKAYDQALRRAWERSHAFPNPLLSVEPPPFAIPDDSRRLVIPPGETPPVPPPAESPAAGGTPPAPLAEPPAEGVGASKPEAAGTSAKSGGSFPPPAPPAGSGPIGAASVNPDDENSRLPVRIPTPPAGTYWEFAKSASGEATESAGTAAVRTVGHQADAPGPARAAEPIPTNPFLP